MITLAPLERLLRNAGAGEALIDPFSLGCCVTEASAYRMLPTGVVVPETLAQVETAKVSRATGDLARLSAARAALADALVIINGLDDGCQIELGTERHSVHVAGFCRQIFNGLLRVLSRLIWLSGDVPQTNSMYCVSMLIAGTLGTASGDYMQGHAGSALGSGLGSVLSVLAFLCVLTVSLKLGGTSKPWYWATIIAARTAGTDLGDFFAGRNGLKLGLPVRLTCTSPSDNPFALLKGQT